MSQFSCMLHDLQNGAIKSNFCLQCTPAWWPANRLLGDLEQWKWWNPLNRTLNLTSKAPALGDELHVRWKLMDGAFKISKKILGSKFKILVKKPKVWFFQKIGVYIFGGRTLNFEWILTKVGYLVGHLASHLPAKSQPGPCLLCGDIIEKLLPCRFRTSP